MISTIRSIIRFCLSPRRLLLLIIVSPCWTALPVSAASSEAQFRVMLPLVQMAPPEPEQAATPEEQVLSLTNALRQQHGCSALQISPELTTAARNHSQDMADHNYFNHADTNGHSPEWRAQQAGYIGRAGTENIAAGYATAEAVVMAWYNETPPNDGHRRNLLNCSLTDIGIGYALNPSSDFGSYWTQDFGQR